LDSTWGVDRIGNSLLKMAGLRKHDLTVPKTARYFMIGPEPEKARGVIIALHGYGQLPEFFLRKFERAAEAGWCVVAPEGLHRFYVQGTNGRVGASWMTKEARDSDIADYIHYLDQVVEEIQMGELLPILLGFSQGVATASRWAAMGQTQFERLILWAGVFPPDYPWETGWDRLKGLTIDVALGTEDAFFDEALVKDTSALLNKREIEHRTHAFKGGHAVDPELLLGLLEG